MMGRNYFELSFSDINLSTKETNSFILEKNISACVLVIKTNPDSQKLSGFYILLQKPYQCSQAIIQC